MRYQSVDPSTGEMLPPHPTATAEEVKQALAVSAEAFRTSRSAEPAERAPRVRRLADLFEREAVALARIAAQEMGKPVSDGEAEAKKCAVGCRWAADEGPRLLAFEPREGEGRKVGVRFDPLGPLLALMPWNFPFWQVVRFAAPALLAGNTVLLKHAPNTPQCALALTALFHEAGFADGAFINLFLDERQASELIAHPWVRGVTLTGSTRAGRIVAAQAGEALKPCVLELGGSDAFVVFADADLEAAAAAAVASRCQNAGQSCIAAKRLLVERSVYADFVDAVRAGLAERRVGPPLEPRTQIGPLARRDLRDGLARQVAALVAEGGRVLLGGVIPDRPGWWYPPTLLVDVPHDAPAAREELFGPVAVVTPFHDAQEAAYLANYTPYGLGASVWTSDEQRAFDMSVRLDAGTVIVNGIVKSDPRLPFGGTKDSGLGRELGLEGLRAFTNTKTVVMH
jgi:succinate-semialdehyde dehydrogenase / glutarate-semialdehyde dehydrogenase